MNNRYLLGAILPYYVSASFTLNMNDLELKVVPETYGGYISGLWEKIAISRAGENDVQVNRINPIQMTVTEWWD